MCIEKTNPPNTSLIKGYSTETLIQRGMDKLEQGRIIERGTHDELIAQQGRYYQLYTGKKAG